MALDKCADGRDGNHQADLSTLQKKDGGNGGLQERGRQARFPAEGARWIGELSLRRERREEEDISANVKIAEEEVVVGYESFSVEYLKGDIRKAASDEQGTQQRLS